MVTANNTYNADAYPNKLTSPLIFEGTTQIIKLKNGAERKSANPPISMIKSDLSKK